MAKVRRRRRVKRQAQALGWSLAPMGVHEWMTTPRPCMGPGVYCLGFLQDYESNGQRQTESCTNMTHPVLFRELGPRGRDQNL